jgi:hypothetical protein
MATSFVSFQNHGFWAADADLEVWLYFLAQQIDSMSSPSDWLREVGKYWHTQATAGFHGFIAVNLDEFANTEDRCSQLVALNEAALQTLRSHGPYLRREELNTMETGGSGSYFTADRPTEDFAKVGEHFIKLLRNELTATESGHTI